MTGSNAAAASKHYRPNDTHEHASHYLYKLAPSEVGSKYCVMPNVLLMQEEINRHGANCYTRLQTLALALHLTRAIFQNPPKMMSQRSSGSPLLDFRIYPAI